MPRKVGTSIVLTQEQMDWVDSQEDSISETIRQCVDYYRENHE